jgi:hypothetical protein
LSAPAAPVIDLAAFKAARKIEIGAEAERQRLGWITPGAGQVMTYARKVEEARAAQVANEPEPRISHCSPRR